MRVDVVDYGAGNLASVFKAFRSIGATPHRVTHVDELAASRTIVVPGVGHFAATAPLVDWQPVVRRRINEGATVLGICLGMQWLFDGSDEAPTVPGLGMFRGRCTRLTPAPGLKVPHVGWNALSATGHDSRLLQELPAISYAYFTHSFVAPVGNECVATTTHGATFASVVERGRVAGTQWHPEKSGDAGLCVLRGFLELAAQP